MRKQPHLSGDETPTNEGQQKAWLWAVVAAGFRVIAVRTTHPIAHRDSDTPAGCNFIAFLAAAIEAHFAGQPTFSLLPSLLSVATIPLA
ncbi:MAG TPA: hypothetical protein VJY15_14395 [Candidatus Acidoferrum sp.]|nr:hypothetical protein [Candidatus Acidoferrum sp.]